MNAGSTAAGASQNDAAITLDPIIQDLPHAFDTEPPLRAAGLTQLEFQWRNPDRGRTIREADDLPAQDPHAVPNGAILAAATIEVEADNWPTPHHVKLRPPGTVSLDHPEDAPVILPWLQKHRFRIGTALADAITILLLTLASAFIADTEPSDTSNTKRHCLAFAS